MLRDIVLSDAAEEEAEGSDGQADENDGKACDVRLSLYVIHHYTPENANTICEFRLKTQIELANSGVFGLC